MPFAHSADPKRGIPPQDYAAHIGNVVKRAIRAANEAGRYSFLCGKLLREIVPLAAEYHDLGKLDKANQDVLSGKRKARSLPVQHTDAGTAYLLDQLQVLIGAVLIRSHHIGLPDFITEQNRGEKNLFRDVSIIERVNQALPEMIIKHNEVTGLFKVMNMTEGTISCNPSLFFRLALSCLADADHTDTAIHYGDQTDEEPDIPLKPECRIAALDRYIENLRKDDSRSRLRAQVYAACRDATAETAIASCDSPVGTGKTTAVMAHILSEAKRRNLRRIIVVLPFTNIITQSVEVYRNALVLPGENAEQVVTELHHRADFQDPQSRLFTARWKAPIIVTTAVSFFETLSSNKPATLRRLHNLPGSAIFIDESHAALPAKLLPLAWHWIKLFGEEWGCYWILASGSLNRFWKIEEFDEQKPDIPEIMPPTLRNRLAEYEKQRIQYKVHDLPLDVKELVKWVATLPGPRIVILNTVQSAAVVAREYIQTFERLSIEHLSTALTPTDRDRTLARVKRRLADPNDTEWTLVATSCIEAGVDLSFRTGIREAASLVSLLQTAGRVNRHDHVNAETVWTVVLKEEELIKNNPAMRDSSKVLLELFASGSAISPDLCTDALKREIRMAGDFPDALMKAEIGLRFPQVEKIFRVIEGDTRTVVVDPSLVEKLENHLPVDWRKVQKGSVQIWAYRFDKLPIPEVIGHPGIFKWVYDYDDFIGYMAGILKMTNDLRWTHLSRQFFRKVKLHPGAVFMFFCMCSYPLSRGLSTANFRPLPFSGAGWAGLGCG